MDFSVVMPVYNKAPYLKRAVSSALSQAHLKELVAVDDGSTDGSGDILDGFAEKDGRVKVLHRKNGGVSAARNTGMAEVSGDYLCFLDGDDCLCEGFFEKARAEMAASEPDIAFFAYEKQSPDGKTERVPSPYSGLRDAAAALRLLCPHQLRTGYFGCSTNKLVKASLALKCAFDEGLKLAEDLDFWVQVMRLAERCLFSEVLSFTYHTGIEGSSCFDEVDYPSQLFLRLRFRKLLEERSSGIDTGELDLNISHYVYFCAASACLEGASNGKNVLKGLFEGGASRKDIVYGGLPLFHRLCLALIKRGGDGTAAFLIRAKQVLKGQKNV